MLPRKLSGRFRRKFFPSEQELMLRKWWVDVGDHEDLRFDYDLNAESVVIDLGGYTGDFASDLFSRYLCRIYVFEPVSLFADKLRERFLKNNRIEVIQYGLGGSSRKEKINICADGSSIYRDSSNFEEIEIVDIKDWLAEKSIERVDLIKINIEGSEYELLESLIRSKEIAMIENIQVQFHNVADDSLLRMENIQRELKKTHEPTYQYKFVWENWKLKNNIID